MRRYSIMVVAALAAAALAIPAFAGNGKGGGGGNTSASISFASVNGAAATQPTYGSSVSFAVSANVKDPSTLWVTNACSQNGVTVYSQSAGAGSGTASGFTLNWAGGGSAQCIAYVWQFPNAGTWLTSMTYSVSG